MVIALVWNSLLPCLAIWGAMAFIPARASVAQDLSRAPALSICGSALGNGWTGWVTHPSVAVNEAERRGYTVTSCRMLLACNNAISEDKTAWRTDPQYARDYEDIRRWGLTVANCRRLIEGASEGVASLESPTAPRARAEPASVNPLVVSIQTLLAALGYDVGAADGVAGKQTSAAIFAFQQSTGEHADGQPSEALKRKLERAISERGPSGSSRPPPGTAMKQGTKPAGAGTGFFIGNEMVITNNHVIDGCAEIRARKNGADAGSLRLVAANRGDDLAALLSEKPNTNYLKLRVGVPIKAGETVLVFGYPLAGALSSLGNTTIGNVTALTGWRDDSRFIQISASVQRGNSGGPVVDDAGRLIGVVVSKLDALEIARVTGDIPQNVNFAIRATTLAAFLDTNRLSYEAATNTASLPNTELAAQSEMASVQLECWK